ncbi:MAG: hypothetical protein KDB57_09575 [Solirubrobacterales bacterium]|nr:hypothetical protein [Solirubrobacterales bacterium]
MTKTRLQELRGLVDRDTGGTVLSVFARTDPRDPENSSEHPGWSINLKNGIRDATASVGDEHEAHQTALKLGAEAERRLHSASAAERGRSVALFLSADGSIDEFHTFQIPVRQGYVTFDSGPVVWPMVDVIDRGQRTGIVLMSNDHIRLLEWFDGNAHDIESSTYDLELGDWKEYRGAARANPTRGQQSVVNSEAFKDRVKEWRNKFTRDCAVSIAEAADDLEFERIIVCADGELGTEFEAAVPDSLRERLIDIIPVNLIDQSANEVADHVDERLREDWRKAVGEVADQALARIKAADRGAGGADETLLALGEGRVSHLIFDPYLDTKADVLSDGARKAIEDAGEASIQEALVELALRTDARVSSASVDEVPALAEAGGVLALLRY